MRDWIIKNAMDPLATEGFRADLASSCKMEDGTVGHGGGGQSVDKNIRVSTIGWPDRSNDLLCKRFDGLEKDILDWNEQYFGFKLDPKSFSWQFTRYSRGGDFYRQHVDCAFDHSSPGNGDIRKLSGSLMLSDPRDLRGGTFRFTQGIDGIRTLEQGEMVVFPSFLPHSVSPIIKGTRESLVFWLRGPNFV